MVKVKKTDISFTQRFILCASILVETVLKIENVNQHILRVIQMHTTAFFNDISRIPVKYNHDSEIKRLFTTLRMVCSGNSSLFKLFYTITK